MIKLVKRKFTQQEWFDILMNFQDLNLMQTWEFAQAKAIIYSWRVERFIFQDGENIIGALQALVKPMPIIGGGLVWINQGPLWRRSAKGDFSLFIKMLKEISRYWVERQHFYVRIAPPIFNKKQFTEEVESIGYNLVGKSPGWSSEKLDLFKTKEQLRKQFKQKWRTDLNGSERSGAECVVGTSKELFHEFLSHYGPFIKNMKLSTRITPKFLYKLQSLLPKNRKAWVFEGRFQGELLGGLLMVGYGDTCIALAGSNPNEKGRKLRSGNLVWWHAILKMKELGYRWFDVGGADPILTPKGILHFKAGLRGTPYQLLGEFECSRDKFLDKALRWYIQQFRI